MLTRLRVLVVLVMLVVSITVREAMAQPKNKPKPNTPPKANIAVVASSVVVDIVTLKSGRPLRGAILDQAQNGDVSVAVSLDWYQTTHVTKVDEVVSENRQQSRQAWEQTRNRITEWLTKTDDSPTLQFFLKQEKERIERSLNDRQPAEPEFLWIDVPQKTITKVARAKPDEFRLALFGWNEKLPHVETLDAGAFRKELTKKGVKLDGPLPDLSDRLPPRPQTDREWSARMALVEYTLVKPLDFQGMGAALARVEQGQPINLGDVLPKVLQEQVGSLLKDLTGDNPGPVQPRGGADWLKLAIRQAEADNRRAFRVTRLDLDATAFRATVESQFVAKLDEGHWQTIWRTTATADGTQVRPDSEQQIEQDPQIKSAIEAMKSLGLIDRQTLQQVIRVGAATMSAQQDVNGQFEQFRERYTRHLDSPRLVISDQQ